MTTDLEGAVMKAATALAVLAAAALPASAMAHGEPTAHANRPHSAAVKRQLKVVKRATAKYRDVRLAVRDGYVPTDECYGVPGRGVMGFHYANPALILNTVDNIRRPDILIYLPSKDGRRRLVAVEWYHLDADQDLSTDHDRPRLFDRPFDGPMIHEPGTPVHFDLHAWLFKHNPKGVFAPFNPAAHC
jgi:hypothetical protein